MWISDLMWQIHKTSKRPVVRRNDNIDAINLIPERNLAENDLKQHFNLCPFLGVNQKKGLKIDLIYILSLHRLINLRLVSNENI